MESRNRLTGNISFFLFMAFLFIMNTSFGQEEKLKVHVLKFDLVDSLSFPKTDVGFSERLESTLSKYNTIDIIIAAGDTESLLSAAQIDSLSKGLTISKVSGIDVIVFGSYVVENRYINIRPLIYDFDTRLFYSLSISRGLIDEIDGLSERVGTNVVDKLREFNPVMRMSLNKVAFLSNFKQTPGNGKEVRGEINNIAKSFTGQLVDDLDYDGIDNAEIIPWNVILSHDEIRAEIVQAYHPELVITLNYLFDSLTPVSVTTGLLIYEKKESRPREFELPEIKADHYQSDEISVQEFAYNEFFQLLNRIIKPDGSLDWRSFTQLKSLGPDDNSYITKAESLTAKNDPYLSSLCYYNALSNEDNTVKSSDIHLQLGFNKIYMYRLDEAEQEFELVHRADPKNSYIYVGKSLIKYFSEDYENVDANINSAIETLEEAKENGLDNELVYEGLMGHYNFEINNYEKALANFTNASKAKRSGVKIRIGEKLSIETLQVYAGLCYIGLKQFDDAIAYFEALKPNFAHNDDILYYLGTSYSARGTNRYFKGDYEGAISDLEASKKYYADPDINDYIRHSKLKLFKYDEALTFIQQEIDNDSYDASFIWKKHARDLRKMMVDDAASSGEYDENIGNGIIKSLEKSLEVYDNDPIAFYNLGEIYTLLGDYQKGLAFIEKAAQTDPFNFEYKLGLMQANLFTGNYEASIDGYKEMDKRKNRKIFDSRTNALMEFFNTTAVLADGNKASKEIKRFNKVFTGDVVISNWDFDPFKKWYTNASLTADAKSTIEELLTKMENTQIK